MSTRPTLARVATRVLSCAAATVALARPITAQTFDTRPPGIAFTLGPLLGGPDSQYLYQSVGETFVVPVGATSLTSFTFYLMRYENTGDPYYGFPPLVGSSYDLGFTAHVREVAGGAPVGPDLYTSGIRTHPVTAPDAEFTAETFYPGGIAVTPGARYVAYLTADASTPMGGRFVGTVPLAINTPGVSYGSIYVAPIYPNNGPIGDGDLAFVATFGPLVTAAPEPATFALLGGGVLLLGAWRKLRRA